MAHLADQKKGLDIRVLEVAPETHIADCFVLVTGLNRPHVKALHEEIHTRLKACGVRRGRSEGTALGWWILVDYGDVVVHLMQAEAREYYDLDGLYGEATEVAWREHATPLLEVRQAQA